MRTRNLSFLIISAIVAVSLLVWANVEYSYRSTNNTNANAPLTNSALTNDTSVDATLPAIDIAALIADAEAETLTPGTYRIVAVVIHQRQCLPCPDGAVCIQCEPEAVLVGRTVDATDRIALLTDTPERFELGVEYQFSFVVDEPYEEPTLVAGERVDTTEEE